MAANKLGKGATIYLAGPISNTTDYIERFKKDQEYLEALGYIVINPTEIEGTSPNLTEEEYNLLMRHCFMLIALRADAIVLMDGWHKSKGAIKERTLGYLLEIPVVSIENIDSYRDDRI